MHYHSNDGEVKFSKRKIVPDQHTTINNKSQVTVTPTSLGKVTLQWCGVAQITKINPS